MQNGQTDGLGAALDAERARAAATLRLLAGALTISFAPVFARLLSLAPTAGAFYRTLIGGAVLAALVLWRGDRLAAPRRAWVAMVAAGFLFALDLALWHRAILYLGPGLATLLGNFQALLLAVAGVAFLGERLRAVTVVAIAAALVGLGLIVGLDPSVLEPRYRMGLILGLATAFAYAGYILALRAARQADPGSSPARDLAVTSLAAAAFLGAGTLAEHGHIPPPQPGEIYLLAAYALVAQVIGWVLISGALPRLPASRVGLVLLLQPALALVWDAVFFARAYTHREVAGAAVVLAAIYLGSRAQR